MSCQTGLRCDSIGVICSAIGRAKVQVGNKWGEGGGRKLIVAGWWPANNTWCEEHSGRVPLTKGWFRNHYRIWFEFLVWGPSPN